MYIYIPCYLFSVACEVWKHFVAFMYFVLLLFVLLLCLRAMCCLSYVALSACYVLLVLCCSACAHCSLFVCIVIVIVFNNLPWDFVSHPDLFHLSCDLLHPLQVSLIIPGVYIPVFPVSLCQFVLYVFQVNQQFSRAPAFSILFC